MLGRERGKLSATRIPSLTIDDRSRGGHFGAPCVTMMTKTMPVYGFRGSPQQTMRPAIAGPRGSVVIASASRPDAYRIHADLIRRTAKPGKRPSTRGFIRTSNTKEPSQVK